MSRSPTGSTVGRRAVLAGLAGIGAAGVAGRAAGLPADDARTLEPTAHLGLPGAAEAVVDEDGHTAYCSLRDGFGVVDLADPGDPTLLAEERGLTVGDRRPMESIMDVKVSGDRLLVSGPNGYSTQLKGFFLYDVSDPANPERVAFHETIFGPHNSFFDGDHVYLTGTRLTNEPVVIFDVADDDPEEVGRWSAAQADPAWDAVEGNYVGCHDVYVQDDALYVAYWDAGTWIVDVSDPANPTAKRRLPGHDPEYLADLPQTGPEFSELPGNSHYVQPNADGSALFVGKEAWDRPVTDHDGGPGGIECWDLSGNEPALQTVLRPPQPEGDESGGWTAHNFGVDGDRLYTSWYSGGVRVYDVGDLANPRLLAEWRDPETTVFWTAKPFDGGFLGASYASPANPREKQRRGEGARIYAFPEPDGTNARPAPTMDRREYPTPNAQTTAWTATTTTTTTTETTTGTTATAETTTGTEATATGTTAPQSTPGFGAAATLLGGGLALRRILGGDDEG